MDFSLSEKQEELARARGAHPRGPHRPPAPEGTRPLRRLVRPRPRGSEFAKANLLGIALPESAGGLGFGFLDLCMVLREVGAQRRAAPGDPDARRRRAADRAVTDRTRSRRSSPKVASGDVLLTAALVELGAEPEQPTTTATRDGDGWRINGVKSNVAGATAAELVLVPASVEAAGSAMFLVPTNATGITTGAPAGDEPRAAVRDAARRRARRRRRAARVTRAGRRDPRVHAQPHDRRDVRGRVGCSPNVRSG